MEAPPEGGAFQNISNRPNKKYRVLLLYVCDFKEFHTIPYGRYMKGLPFLSKMAFMYKRVRVWISRRSLPI